MYVFAKIGIIIGDELPASGSPLAAFAIAVASFCRSGSLATPSSLSEVSSAGRPLSSVVFNVGSDVADSVPAR